MSVAELFDSYGRRARLQPALLVLFPSFVTVAVWNPALYQTAAGLIGLAVACGVTVLLGHVARSLGRRAEKRLNALWGGKPTTIWLRYSDGNVDRNTTARYHQFFAKNVPNWKPPTEADELADPAAADARYESAVRWLLNFTRDRHRFWLVFQENISYGFARNCYGLKPLAVLVAALCAAANAMLTIHQYTTGSTGASLAGGTAALVLSCVALVLWIVIVRGEWVRDAGDAYAHAILQACDGPEVAAKPRTRRRRKRSRAASVSREAAD